jgi:hypothetical protein
LARGSEDEAFKRWILGGRQPGNDLIAVPPSDQAWSRLGLVDEYRLIIQLAALGAGLPLFKELPAPGSWGAETRSSRGGGDVVLVDEAAEQVAATHMKFERRRLSSDG